MTNEAGASVWIAEATPFGDNVAVVSDRDELKLKYTGKDLDEDTGLYYFNARWYDASTGRFISEDPARDGSNWHVYVSNNPLRFVDPTGMYLEQFNNSPFYMQNDKNSNIGGTSLKMNKYGCAAVFMAKAVTALTGSMLTPSELASDETYFSSNGAIKWGEVAKDEGLASQRNKTMSHDEIVKTIDDLTKSAEGFALGAEVSLSDGSSHFVGVKGKSIINGEEYVEIDPTSINDVNHDSSLRTGWKYQNGKVYAPIEKVEGLIVVNKPNIPEPDLPESRKDDKDEKDPTPRKAPVPDPNHPSSENDNDPVGE